MKSITFLLGIIIISCTPTAINVEPITEYCVSIPKYEQSLCLAEPHDTLAGVNHTPMIYVDRLNLNKNFKDLTMHYMMIVSIDGDVYTLSNLKYSCKVKFDDGVNNTGVNNTSEVKIQDMYYVIIKQEYLDSSVVVGFTGVNDTL